MAPQLTPTPRSRGSSPDRTGRRSARTGWRPGQAVAHRRAEQAGLSGGQADPVRPGRPGDLGLVQLAARQRRPGAGRRRTGSRGDPDHRHHRGRVLHLRTAPTQPSERGGRRAVRRGRHSRVGGAAALCRAGCRGGRFHSRPRGALSSDRARPGRAHRRGGLPRHHCSRIRATGRHRVPDGGGPADVIRRGLRRCPVSRPEPEPASSTSG